MHQQFHILYGCGINNLSRISVRDKKNKFLFCIVVYDGAYINTQWYDRKLDDEE